MTTKDYAQGDVPAIAMAVGMPLGLAVGLAFGEPAFMAVGVGIGAAAGLAVGAGIESDLKKRGRIRALSEQERRRRRVFAIAGIAVGLVLFVTLLTVYLSKA